MSNEPSKTVEHAVMLKVSNTGNSAKSGLKAGWFAWFISPTKRILS